MAVKDHCFYLAVTCCLLQDEQLTLLQCSSLTAVHALAVIWSTIHCSLQDEHYNLASLLATTNLALHPGSSFTLDPSTCDLSLSLMKHCRRACGLKSLCTVSSRVRVCWSVAIDIVVPMRSNARRNW